MTTNISNRARCAMIIVGASSLTLGCAQMQRTASHPSISEALTNEQMIIRSAHDYLAKHQHQYARTLPDLKVLKAPPTSRVSYHVPPAGEPFWLVTIPVEYTCPPWKRCAGRRMRTAVEVFLRNDGTPYRM